MIYIYIFIILCYNLMFNKLIVWSPSNCLIYFVWLSTFFFYFMHSSIFGVFLLGVHQVIELRLISIVIYGIRWMIWSQLNTRCDPLTDGFIEWFYMHVHDIWTLFKTLLIIDCMRKMRECIVWFGEVDSETLVLFHCCFKII